MSNVDFRFHICPTFVRGARRGGCNVVEIEATFLKSIQRVNVVLLYFLPTITTALKHWPLCPMHENDTMTRACGQMPVFRISTEERDANGKYFHERDPWTKSNDECFDGSGRFDELDTSRSAGVEGRREDRS